MQDAFRKLDVDDKGYLDEAATTRAVQNSERQPYDVVRQALKEVELDSSRRVELDDYVDVGNLLLLRLPTQLTHDSTSSLPASAIPLPRKSACPLAVNHLYPMGRSPVSEPAEEVASQSKAIPPTPRTPSTKTSAPLSPDTSMQFSPATRMSDISYPSLRIHLRCSITARTGSCWPS